MTATEIFTKLAKKKISDDAYLDRRLDSINSKLICWLYRANEADTIRKRRFCNEMSEIYLKRYIWYINECWKSNERSPRKARLIVEDCSGAIGDDLLRSVED